MTIEKAKEFLASLRSDEDLATRADDAYVAALMKVAASSGESFAEGELRAVLDAAAGRGT